MRPYLGKLHVFGSAWTEVRGRMLGAGGVVQKPQLVVKLLLKLALMVAMVVLLVLLMVVGLVAACATHLTM